MPFSLYFFPVSLKLDIMMKSVKYHQEQKLYKNWIFTQLWRKADIFSVLIVFMPAVIITKVEKQTTYIVLIWKSSLLNSFDCQLFYPSVHCGSYNLMRYRKSTVASLFCPVVKYTKLSKAYVEWRQTLLLNLIG